MLTRSTVDGSMLSQSGAGGGESIGQHLEPLHHSASVGRVGSGERASQGTAAIDGVHHAWTDGVNRLGGPLLRRGAYAGPLV